MTFGPRACLAFLAAALIGCGGNEPSPELLAVQPNRAYSNHDVRLVLQGSDFLPSFRIDPSTDQRVAVMDGFSGRIGRDSMWAPLTQFGWLGPHQISATLARQDAERLVGAPPVKCDVEITDPRGRKTVLSGAFDELGPDTDAPEIEVHSPVAGERYCPGATIRASFKISEKEPGYLTSVKWELPRSSGESLTGFCPVEPGASVVTCRFDVAIDENFSPRETVNFSVKAHDSAGNPAFMDCAILLDERPSISAVTPSAGPTLGGTDVVISGTGFLPDSRAYFGDTLLHPNGGLVAEKGTVISGHTPAHTPGSVRVRVVSRLGEVFADFRYVDSPSDNEP